MDSPKGYKILWPVVKIGVTAGILYLVFNKVKWEDIRPILLQANAYWLVAAVLLTNLGYVIGGFRLQQVLKVNRIRMPASILTRDYMIGVFFTLFLPSFLGSDLYRGFHLTRHQTGITAAVHSILAERLLGMITFTVFPFIGLIFLPELWVYLPVRIGLVIAAVILAGLLLLFSQAPTRLLLSLLDRFTHPVFVRLKQQLTFLGSYHLYKKEVIHTLVLSLFFGLCGISVFYCVSQSLGLGLREQGFLIFFTLVGMLPEEAVALALLKGFLLVGQAVLGGVILLVGRVGIRGS